MTLSRFCYTIIVFKPSLDIALVDTRTIDKVEKNIDKGNSRFGCVVRVRRPRRFFYCKGDKMTNKEAIEILKLNNPFMAETFSKAIDKGIEALENQKTGHWIDNKVQTKLCNCSECYALSKVYFKYCPHCGAKMEMEGDK